MDNQLIDHVVTGTKVTILIQVNYGSQKSNTRFSNGKLGFDKLHKQGLMVSILPNNYEDYTKAYKGIVNTFEDNACNKNCPHFHTQYKKYGVEPCYMKFFNITSAAKKAAKLKKAGFFLMNDYEIRLSFIGEWGLCDSHQHKFLFELVKGASDRYVYTSMYETIPTYWKGFTQASVVNLEQCITAHTLGFKVYLSCDDSKKEEIINTMRVLFPRFKYSYCASSVSNLNSCVTCLKKCDGTNNVVSITKEIKQKTEIKAKRQMKGFTSYHFIYDLMLMSLIAIRLKSLVIFYFYLFIVYFFDLVDFVLSLFK